MKRLRARYGCPVELTLEFVGDKWKTVILAWLKEAPHRMPMFFWPRSIPLTLQRDRCEHDCVSTHQVVRGNAETPLIWSRSS